MGMEVESWVMGHYFWVVLPSSLVIEELHPICQAAWLTGRPPWVDQQYCWVLCSPNFLLIGLSSRVGNALAGYLTLVSSWLPLLYKVIM